MPQAHLWGPRRHGQPTSAVLLPLSQLRKTQGLSQRHRPAPHTLAGCPSGGALVQAAPLVKTLAGGAPPTSRAPDPVLLRLVQALRPLGRGFHTVTPHAPLEEQAGSRPTETPCVHGGDPASPAGLGLQTCQLSTLCCGRCWAPDLQGRGAPATRQSEAACTGGDSLPRVSLSHMGTEAVPRGRHRSFRGRCKPLSSQSLLTLT